MALQINGLFPGELVPAVTVAGCIDIFENVWPNPAETIKTIEQRCADSEIDISWNKASTFGGGQAQNMRTNRSIGISHHANIDNDPVLQNMHNQFNLMLLAASVPYSSRYNIGEPLYHEGYNLLKYSGGQEYHQHYDGTTTTGRIISAICYLNNDFEGGEIEFPYFKIKIKPQPGMLILFPSNFAYSHVAHPVTKGSKYAIVTWIRDRDCG
jgi:predicted 2-oxoglutarate/Fe(II)-dependent dioxygenase YbiX